MLDSTKCLSYWTQAPAPIPDEYRAELGDTVYGCDICQDVCPWNRGVEKRRRLVGARPGSTPTVSLREWLERDGDELVAELERLYVPRNDPRWLRRNALVAAGNIGGMELEPALERFADDDDPMLGETAEWALARDARAGGRRMSETGFERLALLVHEARSPVAALAAIAEAYRAGGREREAGAREPRRRGVRARWSGSSPTPR